MSTSSGSRSQTWLDLQKEHDAIAEEVIERTTPKSATPSQWIRFDGDRRYHAIYAQARGGYWTFCSRFYSTRLVVEACADSTMQSGAARCHCCKSRVRLPYLVPDELVKIRGEVGG